MDKRLVNVCEAGNIEAFYALLEDEPQIVDYIDQLPFTRTPLHLAIIARKLEFAEEIARFNPSYITKLDSFGYNSVHLAAQFGELEMVKSLLEKLELKKEFLRGKENRNPLHVAVISGKIEVVEYLVRNYDGWIMDLTDRNETVFHLAVKNKQLGVLLVLIDYVRVVFGCFDENNIGFANDLLNCKDEEGNTILHLAIMMNQQQVVEALLGSCTNNSTGIFGVDVNSLNTENSTALDIFLQFPQGKRDSKIEQILVQAGAKTRANIALP
ncbi:unnamed protein product [Amaranthus hypochondriacus]